MRDKYLCRLTPNTLVQVLYGGRHRLGVITHVTMGGAMVQVDTDSNNQWFYEAKHIQIIRKLGFGEKPW